MGGRLTDAAAAAMDPLITPGTRVLTPQNGTDMDLENGKPLELGWLSGRVHRLGLEFWIQTPANSAVWAALCPVGRGPPGR